uniref:Receptor-interacting serine-threonine kinase 3 n=1 Tax=Neolamprologus brichardi TaxID=32507 RepID=A0A3Q4I9K3_NEOBR
LSQQGCRVSALLIHSDLDDWEVKGSGGFGQVYKARHQKWCCDVAVKLLHDDDGTSSSLLREVRMMCKGSSPYVIPVLGAGFHVTLQGPPPWPLAFRLTHQVALGINFLHNLSPALLHLDLKPSNVLLDSFLNAKLTDFGLAKFSQSVTRKSKKYSDEEEGGTISYMPPEAFSISYNPTRASDIYRVQHLIWCFLHQMSPYYALSSIVRLRIPQGDRPSLDEIRFLAAGRAGLARLMELMQKCWETKPAQRPTSHVCTIVTEELYKMHKRAIIDAVHGVLKKLVRDKPLRQSSSPGNFCYPATPRLNMHFCNVVGLQLGDNNTMHICATDPLERKRHPTAPSAVNVPPPHLGGWGNKAGGVG